MKARILKWWHCLLIGTGCFGVGIVLVMADRFGYGTFTGLIMGILAWTAASVCWTTGAFRFAKWAGSRLFTKSMSKG
jgi:hypothetical protein